VQILVTGGAGFIGSHLTDKLLLDGHRVIVIDNCICGSKKNLKNHPNLTFYQKDIRNLKDIEPHFINVDWVFHLAALADIVPSIENPREYFETNVDGTFNVLECAKKYNVKRFIYSASSSCYGLPDSFPTKEEAKIAPEYPYALTKYMGEELVLHFAKVYGLPTLSLRFFNVYGPRAKTSGTYGAVMGVFLAQKLKGKPFTVVGDGKQTRDFTYVTDIVDALITAANTPLKGEVFNVGSGGHYSINDLVEHLKGDVCYIPKRPGEPDCTFADISKIKEKLSWIPKVSFKEGIELLLQEIDQFSEAPLWDEKSIENATKQWFDCLSEKEITCS
jgi:UDP-glucose 4-epimerase